MNKPIHVAVGVIQKPDGRILIARRAPQLHQGGLWEFPGGKLEAGEDVVTGLRRELQEELGVEVLRTQPLICIPHDYGDKTVLLDVHRVIEFSGEAHGREGQPILWVPIDRLGDYDFPAANRGIMNAVRLPDRLMITGKFDTPAEYLENIRQATSQGVRLVQLRAGHLDQETYLDLARHVLERQNPGISVMLNTSSEIYLQTQAAGLHLNSRRLLQTEKRPVATGKLLSASVHNEQELDKANAIGVDFMLISPVESTLSHPVASPLGWQVFAELAEKANCPVYALGGMTSDLIEKAIESGGQGIAGISFIHDSTLV